MGVISYKTIRAICYPAFAVCSRPVVLHKDRARRSGAYILAPNHLSHYDIPCLMRVSPRDLDFLSIIEILKHPWAARLFRLMNVVFHDRGRPDVVAMRHIVNRLKRGRVVAMFPEGHLQREESSAVTGAAFKPGVVKLAQLAGAPIVPCVMLQTNAFWRFTAWLPLRHTVYGVAFGEPIAVGDAPDESAARAAALQRLRSAYRALYLELCDALDRPPLEMKRPEAASAGRSRVHTSPGQTPAPCPSAASSQADADAVGARQGAAH
jgi:1-acyl-sn-glycerol-3-phosphate acyltransferase